MSDPHCATGFAAPGKSRQTTPREAGFRHRHSLRQARLRNCDKLIRSIGPRLERRADCEVANLRPTQQATELGDRTTCSVTAPYREARPGVCRSCSRRCRPPAPARSRSASLAASTRMVPALPPTPRPAIAPQATPSSHQRSAQSEPGTCAGDPRRCDSACAAATGRTTVAPLQTVRARCGTPAERR